MELQEMKDLIKELSKSRDNYSLCLRLEEISKSKNFEEGKISRKLINEIISLGNKKYSRGLMIIDVTSYEADTLFIITKILMSKYYYDGSISENEIIDIITTYSDKNDLYDKSLNYRLITMIIEKIAVRRYGNKIYEFFAEILQSSNVRCILNLDAEIQRLEICYLIPLIELFLCKNFYYGSIQDYVLEILKKHKKVPLYYKLDFLRRIVDVLKSENYSNGIITIEHLNLFFVGTLRETEDDKSNKKFDYHDWSYDILEILVGENFKNGKVRNEDFGLISNTNIYTYNHFTPKVINSKNYANGLIPHNWIVILENIKNEALHKALVNLFISDYYANGLITKEQIEDILKIFTTKGEEQKNDNDFNGFVNLLISDIYQDNEFRYEDIKFMLDDKYEVFRTIVDCILKHNDLSKEDKEYYILALLKLENKDKLCDLCSQYIEEKKVKSVREYARNFVYYVLPALPVFNPPKKKVKKPEELVDGSQ